MPARYEIDKERRLVITTVWGPLTLADALAHQHSLGKDPDFDPSFSQVMDLTQITQYDVDANDIFKLAQTSAFSSASRRAIIVKDDLGYGMGRMFEILREMRAKSEFAFSAIARKPWTGFFPRI